MRPPVPGFNELDRDRPYNGPGIYILIMHFQEDRTIDVGSLGPVRLKKGSYAYVGSAKAGLWGRVKRHLSNKKKMRWHIDYISGPSSERKVFWKEYSKGAECRTATALSEKYDGVAGFGCSDCKCDSHLFFLGQ